MVFDAYEGGFHVKCYPLGLLGLKIEARDPTFRPPFNYLSCWAQMSWRVVLILHIRARDQQVV